MNDEQVERVAKVIEIIALGGKDGFVINPEAVARAAIAAMQPEPWESAVEELLPRNAEAMQPDIPEDAAQGWSGVVHVGKALIRLNGTESGNWYSRPTEVEETAPFVPQPDVQAIRNATLRAAMALCNRSYGGTIGDVHKALAAMIKENDDD